MKNSLLVLAVLVGIGTLAGAQTYGQAQSATVAPSTTGSVQSNDAAMATGNGSSAAQEVGEPRFQGTELQKAYQEEPKTDWQNPNVVESGDIVPNAGGGM